MKILLIGKNGQVGHELQRALAPLGTVIPLGRDDMNLSDADSIRRVIREIKPNLIVNAAAYTAVDRAESEPELAMAINGIAPGIMAEEAKRIGAVIVHYSTDYVFDGTKEIPYSENDTPNPLSVYGKTKLAGERAIQQAGVPHYIFRTSWVYAARGHNFVRTILRLARERHELKIVDDQVGAPTWARAIAEITAQVLTAHGDHSDRVREKNGLYHLTAAGAVSWFGFAGAILAEAKANRPGTTVPALIPISTAEYPLPARRPANSLLDNSKLTAAFGLTPPPWSAMLKACMREISDE